MTNKALIIDPLKCNGCKECEVACSKERFGENPEKSCIRIVSEMDDDFFLPIYCQQCEEPPCKEICPRDAIYRNDDLDITMIDETRCVGCKMCSAACPFGAIGFDREKGQSYKCNLCGGDPACARACQTGALTCSHIEMMHFSRAYSSASNIYKVIGGKSQAVNFGN